VPSKVSTQAPTDLKTGAAQLERVLKGLGFRVLSVEEDPADARQALSRFKVRFAPNLQLARLRARAADIALAMGGLATPTLDAISGDDRVAVCFRDVHGRVPIPLRPVLEALPVHEIGAIPMFLGVDADGVPIVQNLATAPHILIAGTTGSGKTTLVQGMIASIVMTMSSTDVELLLIDPKMSDLTMFQKLPHISGGTILSDTTEAISALEVLAEQTLDERTKLLAAAGHGSVSDLNKSAGKTTIKPVVIVVEELADLVDAAESVAARERLLRSLTRLSQRARAAGLHLVLVTQRPAKQILPARLKANLPVRICLQVPGTADSMVILDRPGGEKLRGRGDFLLRRDGEHVRGQALFASREELADLVARLLERGDD
jgi:S-DNA-T family DNA segregation ATPase FtsK/SpoIIIE